MRKTRPPRAGPGTDSDTLTAHDWGWLVDYSEVTPPDTVTDQDRRQQPETRKTHSLPLPLGVESPAGRRRCTETPESALSKGHRHRTDRMIRMEVSILFA